MGCCYCRPTWAATIKRLICITLKKKHITSCDVVVWGRVGVPTTQVRTHNYTWLHVGPDTCFFKLFCDDNVVVM
jgi:hypothetical protein